MRSAIKVTLIVLFSVTVACVVLLMTEYAVRKIVYGQFAMPGRQTELILDRWAAFVNNPNYSANGVRVNAQGFRRAATSRWSSRRIRFGSFSWADRLPTEEKPFIQRSTSTGNL